MSVKHDIRTTIVTGIVCNSCKNELPPMTMEDHLESRFNTECPHTPLKATQVIYETPMMVFHRNGKEKTGNDTPPDGAFKDWVLWCKKNKKSARQYYLQTRHGFTQADEEYAFVKKVIEMEKELGKDLTNIPFKILDQVFGDLY